MASGKSLELAAIMAPEPVVLSEQKHKNRKARRSYQVGNQAHGMSRKINIPKADQMPALNEPFVK